MWVAKLLLSPVKIRIFCPKPTKFGLKLAFWARPCRLIWCPFAGLVGVCGARAVSRMTPIYFIIYKYVLKSAGPRQGDKWVGLFPSVCLPLEFVHTVKKVCTHCAKKFAHTVRKSLEHILQKTVKIFQKSEFSAAVAKCG